MALSCEIQLVSTEGCGAALNALLGPQQQHGLPGIKPRHAVKFLHSLREVLYIALFLGIRQILRQQPSVIIVSLSAQRLWGLYQGALSLSSSMLSVHLIAYAVRQLHSLLKACQMAAPPMAQPCTLEVLLTVTYNPVLACGPFAPVADAGICIASASPAEIPKAAV